MQRFYLISFIFSNLTSYEKLAKVFSIILPASFNFLLLDFLKEIIKHSTSDLMLSRVVDFFCRRLFQMYSNPVRSKTAVGSS